MEFRYFKKLAKLWYFNSRRKMLGIWKKSNETMKESRSWVRLDFLGDEGESNQNAEKRCSGRVAEWFFLGLRLPSPQWRRRGGPFILTTAVSVSVSDGVGDLQTVPPLCSGIVFLYYLTHRSTIACLIYFSLMLISYQRKWLILMSCESCLLREFQMEQAFDLLYGRYHIKYLFWFVGTWHVVA